jgi:hypothetical protein
MVGFVPPQSLKRRTVRQAAANPGEYFGMPGRNADHWSIAKLLVDQPGARKSPSA